MYLPIIMNVWNGRIVHCILLRQSVVCIKVGDLVLLQLGQLVIIGCQLS